MLRPLRHGSDPVSTDTSILRHTAALALTCPRPELVEMTKPSAHIQRQAKQKEWYEQWSMLEDQERFLFEDWIFPNRLEDFRDREVLECGCGGGHHTAFVAPYAKHVVAVDLNTTDLAKERNANAPNVEFVEGDIGTMDLGRKFDIVFSVGVVHHTDDPDRVVRNLIRHVKPGGRLILWVYSEEGNALVKYGVEPVRKLLLRRLPRKLLNRISQIVTAVLYIPAYTLYLLPLKFLPYYEYVGNFRRLSFDRNNLNVFDKLNAPQVDFISEERARRWLLSTEFRDVHISAYKGVSWRLSGTRL
jgi:SAM-dependent methyltransferase